MSPAYGSAVPTPVVGTALSTDDVRMGEILMSLKTRGAPAGPAGPADPTEPTEPAPAAAVYRGLSVRVDAPAAAAFDLAALAAVSPLAASATARPAATPRSTTAAVAKRYAPVVQLEDLRRCFNMPIAAVARKFGICATLLKKICRRHGIQRWPHRQIRSLQKSIDMLRESLAVAKGSNREYIGKKIAAFELTLECIMQDPNTAARGIAAGRLASPAVPGAAPSPAAPARRRASTTALLSPTLSAMAPRPSPDGGLSDDEGLRGSRLASRRASSMSLEAILC